MMRFNLGFQAAPGCLGAEAGGWLWGSDGSGQGGDCGGGDWLDLG